MQNAECRTQNGRIRLRKIISDSPPPINAECELITIRNHRFAFFLQTADYRQPLI